MPPIKYGVKLSRDSQGRQVHTYYDVETGKEVSKNIILPTVTRVITPREKALAESRNMVKTKVPYDDYRSANDFNFIVQQKSQIGSKLFNMGASNCTLSATHCYGDDATVGTARTIVLNKPESRFKEITVDELQPGDLVIQSLPGVPDGTKNDYHTMIFNGYSPRDYINLEGDLVKKGEMEFNYSKGEKSKGQFVRRPKSITDTNEGKTHYRYYRYIPEHKLGNKIRFHNTRLYKLEKYANTL